MLDLLLGLVTVAPGSGMRVLEIGTEPETGTSAAELADWADGSVVSLSQSSRMISRARKARQSDERLVFRRGPLTAGWPAGGPYGLVFCWEVMDQVPRAWLAQCVPGGTVLCPVFLLAPASMIGVARIAVSQGGLPDQPVSAATLCRGTKRGSVQWRIHPAELCGDGDSYVVRCGNPDRMAVHRSGADFRL